MRTRMAGQRLVGLPFGFVQRTYLNVAARMRSWPTSMCASFASTTLAASASARLKLTAGSHMRAHPGKQKAGMPGEDALFWAGDESMVYIAPLASRPSFFHVGI